MQRVEFGFLSVFGSMRKTHRWRSKLQNAFFKSAGLCLVMLGLAACSGSDDESVEIPSEPGKYIHVGRDTVQIFVVRPDAVFTDRGPVAVGRVVFEKCGVGYIQRDSQNPVIGVSISRVPRGCELQDIAYYTELK